MRFLNLLAASAVVLSSGSPLTWSLPDDSPPFWDALPRDVPSPLDAVPRAPNALNQSAPARSWALTMQEGVSLKGAMRPESTFFQIPKKDSQGKKGKKSKRGAGAVQLQNVNLFNVTLAGKDLIMDFDTVEDTTLLYKTFVAVEQPKWSYDASKDKDAKFTGVPLIISGTNQTVDELSTGDLQWGPATIKAPSAYLQSYHDSQGIAGVLGLGAPGGNDIPGKTLPSLLEQIREQKLLDKDVYGLYYPTGSSNTLYVGEVIPEDLAEPAVYVPTSTQTRWAFEGHLNGHALTADIDNTYPYLAGPIDAVTEIFKALDLKTFTNIEGVLYGFVDCEKGAKLTLDVAGLSMVFDGPDSALANDDEGTSCISILVGAEQGDEPTAWSFGQYAMQVYGPILDYSDPKNLKIGFSKLKKVNQS